MIIIILILLLYYLVFVRNDIQIPSVNILQKGQLFEYSVDQGFIEIKNQSQWIVPVLPKNLVWTPDNEIRKVDICAGKDFVLATGKDVYRHFEKDLSVYRGVGYKTPMESFQSYVTDVKYIYYFQCKNDKIEKLLYCPENTVFESSKCVPFNLCRNKPDGYVYENPDNETYYFRCEHQLPRSVKCPDEHIFVSGACIKPSDPCMFHPDFHIYEHDESSYKQCLGRKTQTVRCLRDEYFHADLKQCVPDTCKNMWDGDIVQWREFRDKLNYVGAYKRCKNGIEIESVDCSKQPADPTLERLPLEGLVYDNGECRQPRWCQNVYPLQQNVMVPGTRFKKKIANYAGSDYLDALYGYRCENGQSTYHELEPNRVLNSTLDIVQLNDSGKSPNFSDKSFRSYYDVDTGKVQQCPANHFFDLMAKKCIPDIPNAWTLDFDWDGQSRVNLPIFNFKNLDPLDNWYFVRHALKEDKVECDQVRIPHYNLCSDPECIKYPFLKQLKDRVIYIDDMYECAIENNKLVRRRHQRKGKLNFWKQNFETQTQICQLGDKLESGDFTMDSTIYATCDFNVPFAFCPSNSIDHVSKDGVCVFRKEFLDIIVEPGQTVRLHRDCINEISSDNATYTINGTDTYFIDGAVKPIDLGIDTSRYFTIKCDKPMTVARRRIPTNNPERYVNRNLAVYRTFFYGSASPSDEIEMEEYSYNRCIEKYY